MAISGGYAGQLFGYLVGFGISMLKLTLTKGAQKFELFTKPKEDILEILVLGSTSAALLCTFVFGLANKFHMNRIFAGMLMLIYVVFLGAASVFAIQKAIKTF